MAEDSERKSRKDIITMIREHSNYRRYLCLVIPVALILVVAVYWGLHVNAITMNSTELVCTIEEHTHTEDCYAWLSAAGSVLEEGSLGTESTTDSGAAEDTESTEDIE